MDGLEQLTVLFVKKIVIIAVQSWKIFAYLMLYALTNTLYGVLGLVT